MWATTATLMRPLASGRRPLLKPANATLLMRWVYWLVPFLLEQSMQWSRVTGTSSLTILSMECRLWAPSTAATTSTYSASPSLTDRLTTKSLRVQSQYARRCSKILELADTWAPLSYRLQELWFSGNSTEWRWLSSPRSRTCLKPNGCPKWPHIYRI